MPGQLTLARWWTGPHVDGKNVEGSYSALVVAELGDPVAGGFYMLPQVPSVSQSHRGTDPVTHLAPAGTRRTRTSAWRSLLLKAVATRQLFRDSVIAEQPGSPSASGHPGHQSPPTAPPCLHALFADRSEVVLMAVVR